MKYPKIQTVFKRCIAPNTKHHKKLIDGAWTRPEFEALAGCPWEATEKIDGMNVGVVWDEDTERVRFVGRTRNAMAPMCLVEELVDVFSAKAFLAAGLPSMVVFGEGFGAGIQDKVGRLYCPDGTVLFAAFDVYCGGLWLQRADVLDVARKLGIPVAPGFQRLTLMEALAKVQSGFASWIGDGQAPAEGLVLRAPLGLLTRRGKRIITKIKTVDFTRGLCPPEEVPHDEA